MNVIWSTTKYNREAPIIDGYFFEKNQQKGSKRYWRCRECNVTAITVDQSLDKVNGEHDHLLNPAEDMQTKFKKRIRETISSQPTLSSKEVSK